MVPIAIFDGAECGQATDIAKHVWWCWNVRSAKHHALPVVDPMDASPLATLRMVHPGMGTIECFAQHFAWTLGTKERDQQFFLCKRVKIAKLLARWWQVLAPAAQFQFGIRIQAGVGVVDVNNAAIQMCGYRTLNGSILLLAIGGTGACAIDVGDVG